MYGASIPNISIVQSRHPYRLKLNMFAISGTRKTAIAGQNSVAHAMLADAPNILSRSSDSRVVVSISWLIPIIRNRLPSSMGVSVGRPMLIAMM